MFIYTGITLRSIISFLFAVTFHNSFCDFPRHTDLAAQTADTMPFKTAVTLSQSEDFQCRGLVNSNLCIYFSLHSLVGAPFRFPDPCFFLYKLRQRAFLQGVQGSLIKYRRVDYSGLQ